MSTNTKPNDAGAEDKQKEQDNLDLIAISVRSHRLLKQLVIENPKLQEIMRNSRNETEALVGVKFWVLVELEKSPDGLKYYTGQEQGRLAFEKLSWQDYGAIRLLDYIDHAGMEYADQNLRGEMAINNPIKMIWLAVTHGTGGAKPYFFEDMLHLFRQFAGVEKPSRPSRETVEKWMERWPSGLDPRIVRLREENRERIIRFIIQQIDDGETDDERFRFDADMSPEQKYLKVLEWWRDHRFHLRFAIRKARDLNKLLGYSLDPDTMKILIAAEEAGIPFFVNPYYLSLLHVRVPYFAIGADLAIRHYVVYSRELVHEFGHIVAWEKEDKVEEGKPNAAGWILPSHHNVHRRYPEVAILIPDTMGRACGGLCASCQRMYEFQRGHLNFNLDKLKPGERWPEKLERLLDYFENDAQLRDILITGGDGLKSTDGSLNQILEAILRMARRKKEANRHRNEGEKYAELLRVRIGTRLPVNLPQRMTPELSTLLAEFKKKGEQIGIRQFIIQTHFESPMEVTPESRACVRQLIAAGWTVINQHVLTAASSRRGHTCRLRQVLNEIGVLTYYTFTVKGYMENTHNFATNARAVQEQLEEKVIGNIPPEYHESLKQFPLQAEMMIDHIAALKEKAGLPFLATDRNVLNLPGLGKSLTYRVIGITRYGRRILEFDHDATRRHSPIIHKTGKIIIIESKSIAEYLNQLEEIGEKAEDYNGIYGYSMGETEARLSLFDYPDYAYTPSDRLTNLDIGS